MGRCRYVIMSRGKMCQYLYANIWQHTCWKSCIAHSNTYILHLIPHGVQQVNENQFNTLEHVRHLCYQTHGAKAIICLCLAIILIRMTSLSRFFNLLMRSFFFSFGALRISPMVIILRVETYVQNCIKNRLL